MALNYYQQNKNKINKVSTMFERRFKWYKSIIKKDITNSLIIQRSFVLSVINTGLTSRRLNIFIECIPGKVKTLEKGGRFYWYCTIVECRIHSLSVGGGSVLEYTFNKGGTRQEIEELAYMFIEEQLNPLISSYRKPLGVSNQEELNTYIDADSYYKANENEKTEIIKESELFDNLVLSLDTILSSKISARRHKSILKSLDNQDIIPLLWYIYSEDSYSYQHLVNSDFNPSTSERKLVSEKNFESDIDYYITSSVKYLPLNNWITMNIDCSLALHQQNSRNSFH